MYVYGDPQGLILRVSIAAKRKDRFLTSLRFGVGEGVGFQGKAELGSVRASVSFIVPTITIEITEDTLGFSELHTEWSLFEHLWSG